MDEAYYKYLVKRYLEKKSTDKELEVFIHLTKEGKLDKCLLDAMDQEIAGSIEIAAPAGKAKVIPLRYRWRVAASILLLLSIGLYTGYRHYINSRQIMANQAALKTIKPGGNNAVLTLANGSKIILNNVHNGQLTMQGHISINKINSGKLVYQSQPNAANATAKPTYNTVTTPAGGQYQLVLADGTTVWLDALSSIRYPAVFEGNERDVELQGEAYFEVAKNKAMPFHVISNGQTVEVLGTHFNINAYADEPEITTTLLEGKVKIWNNNRSAVLAPGQQSVVKNQVIIVSNTDTRGAVAWKNGYFRFTNTEIAPLMRQISRWYNVNIVYTSAPNERKFTGGISRDANIASVILMLKDVGIDATMKGSTIVIAQK